MNWLVFTSRSDDEKLFCGRAGERRAVRCGAFCVVGLFFFCQKLCQCQASISIRGRRSERRERKDRPKI